MRISNWRLLRQALIPKCRCRLCKEVGAERMLIAVTAIVLALSGLVMRGTSLAHASAHGRDWQFSPPNPPQIQLQELGDGCVAVTTTTDGGTSKEDPQQMVVCRYPDGRIVADLQPNGQQSVPQPPQLVSPSNGAQLDTLIPTLSFNFPTNGATATPELQYSTDPNFGSLQGWWRRCGGTDTSFSAAFSNLPGANLPSATRYYWRAHVAYGNACTDSVSWSGYSPTWSFTTGSGGTILPGPQLLAPANNSTVHSPRPVLQWQTSPSATGYLVRAIKVGSTSGYFYRGDVSTTNYQFWLDFAVGDSYDWSITLRNAYAWGNESAKWRFTIGSSTSISGRVTDVNGSGIPGVNLSDGMGHTAMTNGIGNYTLAGAIPGTRTVTPAKVSFTFSPASRAVALSSNVTGVDFTGYDKPPIVFVHGWNGLNGSCEWVVPGDYFQQVDNLLHDNGYYVAYARLESSSCYTPPIEESVWRLEDAIQLAKAATNQPRVILVAHSMGGLVSRAYMEGSTYNNDIAQLFTFGSPHQGVPDDLLAFFANGLSFGTYCGYQAAVCDFSYLGMQLFNQSHPFRVAGVAYHVISGDAPLSPRTIQGTLADALLGGADDGAVQTVSGLGLSGKLDRWSTDETHSAGSGPRNYFTRDEVSSTSYVQCLKRVLVDHTADNCGTFGPAQSTMATTPAITPRPSQTRRSLFHHGNLLLGQTSDDPIIMEGGSSLFAAHWITGTLLMTLVNPSGEVIDPAYAVAHPGTVTFEESEGYATYSFPDTAAGTWHVRLHVTNAPTSGAGYTAFATFESGLTLSGSTDRSWYAPGTSAMISATLAPTPQNAVVTATILLADATSTSVTLTSVGDGQYRGNYTIPAKPGYTELRLVAAGASPDGTPFERGTSLVFQISPTTVALNGVYSDTPELRSPGAITYKALQVAVGVNVSGTGTYGLSADLVDGAGNYVAHANTTGALSSGIGTLALRFLGADINASEHDGPYTVTNLMLTDQNGATLVAQEAQDVYTTAAFQYGDFRIGDLFLPSVMK